MKSHMVYVEEGKKKTNVIIRGKAKTQMVLKRAQPMRKGWAGPELEWELEGLFSVLSCCLCNTWVCKVAKQTASLLLCAFSALIMK